MTSAELAALITAIGVSLAGILTAVAALMNARNTASKISDLEKTNLKLAEENRRLSDENDLKSQHNQYQDAVILDQHRKIEQWGQWGDRVGRQLNEMQLQMGFHRRKYSNDDTQPLELPKNKDWVTGQLGPIDVSELKKLDDEQR